MRERESVTPSN